MFVVSWYFRKSRSSATDKFLERKAKQNIFNYCATLNCRFLIIGNVSYNLRNRRVNSVSNINQRAPIGMNIIAQTNAAREFHLSALKPMELRNPASRISRGTIFQQQQSEKLHDIYINGKLLFWQFFRQFLILRILFLFSCFTKEDDYRDKFFKWVFNYSIPPMIFERVFYHHTNMRQRDQPCFQRFISSSHYAHFHILHLALNLSVWFRMAFIQ